MEKTDNHIYWSGLREEYVVIPLDEVNLDIDRSNMIQNEADAQLLENIEAGLIIALK